MSFGNEALFQPRDGRTLKVVVVCRISTDKQDERSLDDQAALVREYMSRRYQGEIEFRLIQSQGSGEILDRKELYELEQLIESKDFDVVISEDLGRICRRRRAIDFCEICEDCDVRLIAINDNVDTATKGWQDAATMSAWHHERSNRDTSDRIRRSLRSRFQNGGVFQCPIYGYIKPEKTESERDVSKDPAAEPIYDHWFTMLEQGATFADVADWLNDQKVKPGPYSRSEIWTCRMVGRVTSNPVLKGMRVRNLKKSKRVNRKGKRKSVYADPSELLTRDCPHLAFVEPERYDRVIELLKRRNAKYRRVGKEGRDHRKDAPKKRTRFPGQAIVCGICGRGFVFGGHGQMDHLMCDGARSHSCWNGITVNGPKAAQYILQAVLSSLEELPGYDEAFLAEVEEAKHRIDIDRTKKQKSGLEKVTQLNRKIENLVKVIEAGNFSDAISQKLQTNEAELRQLEFELKNLQKRSPSELQLPDLQELKELARQQLSTLALDSWEFRNLMQQLIPKIVVFPYQLCDGGGCVFRAKFRLRLSGFINDSRTREVMEQKWEKVIVVDLYDPPQREFYRTQIAALRFSEKEGKKMTEKEVSQMLGLTVTATQRAAALQREMDLLGIDDPYLPLTTPPEQSKLRRHHHRRYHFDPLPGAGEL